MPRRVESPPALQNELLDWIAARPRSYDDAIEAWRSNCPRHPVLDDGPGSAPPEVPLFEALWEAGDVVPEVSFTALVDGEVVGHATASKAAVAP